MKTIILLLLFTVCCYCLQPHPMTSADEKGEADSVSGDYLLMQPIHDAITSGDFSRFTHISAKRISVNFEAPFQLSGYLPTNKFIDDFSPVFALFEREKIEWSSRQIESDIAVQSLNIILKNKRSGKNIYYKFIFFLEKKHEEWQIYYLRGLRL